MRPIPAAVLPANELTDMLVRLDKVHRAPPAERWQEYYARELVHHFSPADL